jgi:hypothetical protein
VKIFVVSSTKQGLSGLNNRQCFKISKHKIKCLEESNGNMDSGDSVKQCNSCKDKEALMAPVASHLR